MTEREKRSIRKIWREKTKKHRDRLKLQSIGNCPVTQPSSTNDEHAPPVPEVQNNVALAAKKRSEKQRKFRNRVIKKQKDEIERLRAKLKKYQKKLKRVEKHKMSPNSKVVDLLKDNDEKKVEAVKKKLLFSEVMQSQLTKNMELTKNDNEKKIFRKVLSGKIVNKYRVLDQIKIKPLIRSPTIQKSLLDITRKTRTDKINLKLEKLVIEFFEDDCNSRLCPGKKDSITKNKIKKQKRFLLDSMKNLFSRFIQTKNIKISYTMFCRLRPFWVVSPNVNQRETCLCVTHTNLDLTLFTLKRAGIIDFSNHQEMLNFLCCDRYKEECLLRECNNCKSRCLHYHEFDNSNVINHASWQCIVEEIIDPKAKIKRKVRKYVKRTTNCPPKDLIMKLENELPVFLRHVVNIVHQYQVIKSLKDNLTETEAVVHMDFSENYNTKYSEEVQSFHFGGSRTQISLHTVVLYLKTETKCFASLSQNLQHNVPAIWAHLKPVMELLPDSVDTVHFLSDGPVTQYRNKDMFYYLACQLTDAYPNISDFTWNYHEAGHGKGAPDGVGGTCKRIADKVVASGTDVTNINELAKALDEHCPGIKIFMINEEEIQTQKNIIEKNRTLIKPFVGTLKVHQVRGNASTGPKLYMKNLSCFCSNFCGHFNLGEITYASKDPAQLNVDEIYTDFDDDTHDMSLPRNIANSDVTGSDNNNSTNMPSCSKSADDKNYKYKNGDFVLVQYHSKNKDYRYAGVCSSNFDVEQREILVTFLKICDDNGTLFKLDDNDVANVKWEQILKKLPMPNIVIQGNRLFYKFLKPVDVFEK